MGPSMCGKTTEIVRYILNRKEAWNVPLNSMVLFYQIWSEEKYGPLRDSFGADNFRCFHGFSMEKLSELGLLDRGDKADPVLVLVDDLIQDVVSKASSSALATVQAHHSRLRNREHILRPITSLAVGALLPFSCMMIMVTGDMYTIPQYNCD